MTTSPPTCEWRGQPEKKAAPKNKVRMTRLSVTLPMFVNTRLIERGEVLVHTVPEEVVKTQTAEKE
eukprot:2175399-Lingulodinium_polyedra.AAC.1